MIAKDIIDYDSIKSFIASNENVKRTDLTSMYPTATVNVVIWRLIEEGFIEYDGGDWNTICLIDNGRTLRNNGDDRI